MFFQLLTRPYSEETWHAASCCLVELAGCRSSLFAEVDIRLVYVKNMAHGLIELMTMGEQQLFSNPKVHANLSRALLRFEINYQVRDLHSIGREFLASYLEKLH